MMPKLVDIHSHLNFPDFDPDLDEVVGRMSEAGIWTIVVGADFESSKKAIEIAEKYEGVFASVGLHPDDDNKEGRFDTEKYRELAKSKKVVAIGECGLDIKSQNSNLKSQRDLFISQIELAKEVNKPLMIHCRGAHDEVLEILKRTKHYGNIHFFTGTIEQAQQYFDLGFTISFTGVITFARDYDEVISKSPLDKIMIETDAPFACPLTPERSDGGRVAPVPRRGMRNEPFFVIEVAQKIAEIKNLSFDEVAEATTKNALTLFSLLPKEL